MDNFLASTETCAETKFVCSGTMVIELREFNDKKKKKNTMDKMHIYSFTNTCSKVAEATDN